MPTEGQGQGPMLFHFPSDVIYFWTRHTGYLGAGQLPGERTSMLSKLCLCPALNLPLSLPPHEIGVCVCGGGLALINFATPHAFSTSGLLPPETSQSMHRELSSLLHVKQVGSEAGGHAT